MKKSSILLLIVIALATAMIMTIYIESSTYSSFTDAKKKNTELYVSGVLNKSRELYYEPTEDPNYFSFYIIDNDKVECKVVFKGAKPQDIERSEKIVLTGRMVDDVFIASKILMKCPSKYNRDEVEAISYGS